MDKIIWIVLIVFLFSSCATLLNKDVQKISISSSKEVRVVSVDSAFKTSNNNHTYYVERGDKLLRIELAVDSIKQTWLIKPNNSTAYWSNILFNYGIGMLVEKDNPKRFAYRKGMYFDLVDNNIVISQFAPTPKGTINLHIALPYVNVFHVAKHEGYRSSAGFWGFERGLDYFYRDNRFVSIYGGFATDFFVPVPAAVTKRGEHHSSTGRYFNVRNNRRIGRVDLGYGLAYSDLIWRISNYEEEVFVSEKKRNSTAGASFFSSYRLGKYFHLGLLYQPYFVRFDHKLSLDYQYQISMEFIWKVRLGRLK